METEVCFVGMGNCLGWVLRERVRDFYAARGIESESVHASKMAEVTEVWAGGHRQMQCECECGDSVLLSQGVNRKLKTCCFHCGHVFRFKLEITGWRDWDDKTAKNVILCISCASSTNPDRYPMARGWWRSDGIPRGDDWVCEHCGVNNKGEIVE